MICIFLHDSDINYALKYCGYTEFSEFRFPIIPPLSLCELPIPDTCKIEYISLYREDLEILKDTHRLVLTGDRSSIPKIKEIRIFVEDDKTEIPPTSLV